WALQICEQLRFMHEQKLPILHRDLTPDNMMLDRDGNVRIIDFGAAHQFMEGVTGTLIGKQSYIAPEQLRGKATKASDIYSLGATLSFLLTGEDPKALQRTNLKELHTDISNEMAELVSRCTEFEESERPASLEEVTRALSEIANRNPSNKSQHDSTVPEKGQIKSVLKALSETINSEIEEKLNSTKSETDKLKENDTQKIDLASETANGEVKLRNDDSVIVELKRAEEVES
ncbi:MAG TPA: protein kinase, partial [Pseudobdellovibrionaceae bacterium]|nr:protein kinase [Pseudobdellovibrionaceae bacterium]